MRENVEQNMPESIVEENKDIHAINEDNDEDDINDFFDEFEKTTGGENFRRNG